MTDPDIKNFFSLMICMGLVHKTDIEKYWSTNDINSTPYFTQRMPREKLLSILCNLHLVNNEMDDHTNPLFKVRPMATHTSEIFLLCIHPKSTSVLTRKHAPGKVDYVS